jgi:hypothetical protein
VFIEIYLAPFTLPRSFLFVACYFKVVHGLGSFNLTFFTAALALGEPSVKIEDVTPKIFPSGSLFPTEVSAQLNLLP